MAAAGTPPAPEQQLQEADGAAARAVGSSSGIACGSGTACGGACGSGTACGGACGSGTACGGEVVLLYYKYVPLAGREAAVADWYRALCGALRQAGRVRVAADGVNATVRRRPWGAGCRGATRGAAEAVGHAVAALPLG